MFGLLIGGEWQAENSFIKELRGIGVSVYSPPGGLLRLVHKVSGFLHRPPLVKTQLGRRLTTLFFVFVLDFVFVVDVVVFVVVFFAMLLFLAIDPTFSGALVSLLILITFPIGTRV